MINLAQEPATSLLYQVAFIHIIILLLKAYLVLCRAFKITYLNAPWY
jgi:hypothetical protein